MGPNKQPFLGIYPCDSREIYYENVADVDGRKGQPTVPAGTRDVVPGAAAELRSDGLPGELSAGARLHLAGVRDGGDLARLPQGR